MCACLTGYQTIDHIDSAKEKKKKKRQAENGVTCDKTNT